ncbi:MAG: ABC transporter ATP-binding protein [Patescibacteria group bacterium]
MPVSMDGVILCADLRLHYGRHKVLRGVDLEVPPGVIFALLGVNGAGKTSLIRTMLGLMPRAAGRILVLGRDPWLAGPDLRQRLGYVSEEQGLYNWMRLSRLVGFCRGLYERWNEELVREYLERFSLSPNARVGDLSKGQKVRLALILALAPEPELLILDEPMSGLDPLAQHEFLRLIQQAATAQGRTIFFSTHNLADVEAIATHVAVLDGGRVQAAGAIGEVRASVRKIRLSGRARAGAPPGAYLLEEDGSGATYLVPREGLYGGEAAAAGLGGGTAGDPATLQEVFLYYCAGRGRDGYPIHDAS